MSFVSLVEFRAACRRDSSQSLAPLRRVVVERTANLDPTFFAGSRIRVGRPTRITHPYKEHAGVNMVVTSRMRTFVQAPFTIGRELSDGRLEPVRDTESDAAKQLINIFKRPNRFMTGRRLWMHTRSWLDIIGEAFWVLGRKTVTEVPRWIQPWPGGSLWEPGPVGPDGYPVGWIFRNPRTGKKAKVSADRLVFFRTVNPQNLIRGIPPLVAATTRLNADVEADDRDLAFFENNAEMGGYISYPTPVDEDRWAEIQARHEDRHMGARKQFKLGVLDDGATFIQNKVTNRDMEYLKMREFNFTQVRGTYSWSDVFMGGGANLPFANFIAQLRAGWENTIIPQQEIDAEEVEVQLLRHIEGGRFVGFFDHSKVAALRQAREQQWGTVKTMKETGVSLKEATRQLGIVLEPQPGWDSVLVPGILLPIEDVISGASLGGGPEPEPTPEPVDDDTRPADADDDRPDTGTEPGLRGMDGRMAQLIVRDERHASGCELALLAKIEAITDRTKQLTGRQRRAKWLSWNAGVLRPSERALIRGLRPYFRDLATFQLRQFDRIARERRSVQDVSEYQTRVIEPEDIEDILFTREAWDSRLRTVMRPALNTALDLSLAFTTQELTELVGPQVIGIDLNTPQVQRFLDARVQLTTGINARIRAELARQLQAGFANNESIPELRTRVESVSNRLTDPARSLRIARTESGTMANTLRFQLADEFVDFQIWISAADENVRNTHFVAELTSSARPVRIGETFSNGLLYPLDPAGPPEEVINCRCLAEFVPVSETLDRAMTADELRSAFFAGIEAVVERWSAMDTEVWGGRLLHLNATKTSDLVPYSCNGRHE